MDGWKRPIRQFGRFLPNPKHIDMAGRTFAGRRHAKTAAIVKQILFRFGRNWSIPRQWPSGGTCFRMSLDAWKRVPPLVSQTVLTTQLDIRLRSQPDHERSFASAAHSDTSNREIGNT